MPSSRKVISYLLLVIGLVVGLVLVNQKQNIFTKAWTGFTANLENIARQLTLNPTTTEFKIEESAEATKKLFHILLAQYSGKAEIQNIDLPKFGISGVAMLKYDETINKTFVYSRIENLPRPSEGIVRLWVVKNINTYTPVGIVDFVRENNNPVGYSVFVQPGDLRVNDELLVSYDPSVTSPTPQGVAISLKF